MPYQSFQPTYCSKGGIITQQAPVILLLILLYSTYILTLPSTFEQSQVAPPEFAHYSNFSRISYPWIGRTDNLPKYTPMWVKRSNVQDTIYKASFLSSFPPDNGVTVQKVDQLEKDPPNTELDRKEVRTSPSERVTSFPETYWVEAGKKGSGVNESFPSGNITYVLRHYNLTNAVVKVKPGTYGASIENFPLTVSDRNVTLEGTSQSSETIITQGSTLSSIGIKITGDFVTVRRFTIVEASFGIELYHSQYHTITGNKITENDVGIKMSSSNFNRIDNNHITQNQCGLCLESSESNRINGNTFQANTYGSYLLSSPKNVVKTNKIIKNIERGVRLWRSNNNLVYNNKFLQNEVGLEVRACVSISVEHNVITGNELGLYFYDLSNFMI
ncbi:MAG: hypothetical protein GWO20_16055 [Candidatus Korarchaeota archaeon]|nr:hypothetical protein [Candidatus Korarchaeota archaeon]NIU84910.1 hypothetical protein [Candidatus Thorarchaeota archaeon]NIW14929.1 hypothetical protein [Candidatus Thorarchaeota archaeon]NIW52969.1 hypothetical protein [Candidatus Korarchaeota archaeon]